MTWTYRYGIWSLDLPAGVQLQIDTATRPERGYLCRVGQGPRFLVQGTIREVQLTLLRQAQKLSVELAEAVVEAQMALSGRV